MAQGAAKKTTNPNLSKKNKKSSALGPKKGQGMIAPKKQKLIAQKKLMKKHTAGLIALTEKNLAEKAGHLEMLGGGKREKKVESGKKKK